MIVIGKISDTVKHIIASDPLPLPSAAAYEYIFHRRGIMLRATNEYYDIRLPLVNVCIRGLPLVKPRCKIRPLPGAFLQEILDHSRQHAGREVVYYLIRSGGKLILKVGKYGTVGAIEGIVDPAPASQILAQIHSHGRLGAFFSPTDNANETEFRIFGVVAKVDSYLPEVIFRLGVYGHHFTLNMQSVFSDPDKIKVLDRFGDGKGLAIDYETIEELLSSLS